MRACNSEEKAGTRRRKKQWTVAKHPHVPIGDRQQQLSKVIEISRIAAAESRIDTRRSKAALTREAATWARSGKEFLPKRAVLLWSLS